MKPDEVRVRVTTSVTINGETRRRSSLMERMLTPIAKEFTMNWAKREVVEQIEKSWKS